MKDQYIGNETRIHICHIGPIRLRHLHITNKKNIRKDRMLLDKVHYIVSRIIEGFRGVPYEQTLTFLK